MPPSFSTGHHQASIRKIAGAGIAFAAACTLAVSSVIAAEPRTDDVIAPTTPMPTRGNSELGNRINSSPGLVIAGERLNVPLLRRFYSRHGFEPVWTTRQPQAISLLNAVLHAGDH